MRLRVGYSPWDGWDCWIVMAEPWWYVPVLSRLDVWVERFSGWPSVRDRIWALRTRIAEAGNRWRRRQPQPIWWEYRAR